MQDFEKATLESVKKWPRINRGHRVNFQLLDIVIPAQGGIESCI